MMKKEFAVFKRAGVVFRTDRPVYFFRITEMSLEMNPSLTRATFGNRLDYIADGRSFVMGIDRRFTKHFAERFFGLNVLEACTGVGFTTISPARTATHISAVEMNKSHQKQTIGSVQKAGLSSNATLIHGNTLEP